MKIRDLFLSSILILLFLAKSTCQPLSATDYQIYSGVLTEFFSWLEKDKRIVVNRKVKGISVSDENLQMKLEECALPKEILQEVLLQKPLLQQSWKAQLDLTKIHLPLSISVISKREVRKIFRKDAGTGWETFLETYQDAYGIITLSVPWVSKNGKYGLLYLAYTTGARNGRGQLLILDLERVPTILDRITLWVS